MQQNGGSSRFQSCFAKLNTNITTTEFRNRFSLKNHSFQRRRDQQSFLWRQKRIMFQLFLCPVPVVGTFISHQDMFVLHVNTFRGIWGVCWYTWEFFCPKTMMPEKITQPVATRVTKGRRFNEIAKVWTKILTLKDETTCRDRCSFLELCLICVNICER